MINRPTHYMNYSREVIELTRLCDNDVGNALKYVLRAGLKGPAREDFCKALWYLLDELGSRKEEEPSILPNRVTFVAHFFVADLQAAGDHRRAAIVGMIADGRLEEAGKLLLAEIIGENNGCEG